MVQADTRFRHHDGFLATAAHESVTQSYCRAVAGAAAAALGRHPLSEAAQYSKKAVKLI